MKIYYPLRQIAEVQPETIVYPCTSYLEYYNECKGYNFTAGLCRDICILRLYAFI